MKEMDTGIKVNVHGNEITIKGRIVAAPCDSLGSSALGGYKMPGPFSNKPCRSCTLTNNEIQKCFQVSKLNLRQNSDHKDYLNLISQNGTTKEMKQYWSKWYGIVSDSPLLKLDYINLQKVLVHDPMHVILEGVFQKNLLILVQLCVKERYFTIEWLNTQLQSFKYSYLDAVNKPQKLDHKTVIKMKKIKQNAGAMMTLAYILPLILATKASKMGKHYENFMRLIRIVVLVFSPMATDDSAGELQVLVENYLRTFCQLYDDIKLTPKMHFLLHLVHQFEFGPLRYCSVIRMEAKHNFFKQLRIKQFRNLSLTLSERHQKQFCYEIGDMENSKFLSSCDEVFGEKLFVFDDAYPILVPAFRAEIMVNYQNGNPGNAVSVNEVKKLVCGGLTYESGACLLIGWDDKEPIFGQIKRICIYKELKFFVVNVLSTCYYDWKFNAYEVEMNETIRIILHRNLRNKWPVPMYIINGLKLITNRYCHFGSGFM